MSGAHLGELAALVTAICWTISALTFEIASKQVGSTAVNLLKLCLALPVLAVYCLAAGRLPLPFDASAHNWIWLSVAGVVAFVFGDLCLFRAYAVIGARISLLIMASSPLMTAVLGWVFLGERLTALTLLGMGLTVGSIALVVLQRAPASAGPERKLSHSPAGILLAFGGSLGQALALTLGKYGMGSYNPVAATQIQQLAGAAGLLLVGMVGGKLGNVELALRDWRTLRLLLLGSTIGPALGISLSLVALQHTSAAVAATLVSTTPILIIVPSVLLFKARVTPKEVACAIVAVAGVSLLFL